jgi:mannose-1-phosphate guanylyltransferase / mannose-6-phosphate isomerase
LRSAHGDEHQNVFKGDVFMLGCEDSMVHSTTDKPIAVIGLSGIVVVDTPDGLLVCAKEQAQLVKKMSENLASRKPEK